MAFRAISPPAETQGNASADCRACSARASQTRPRACSVAKAVTEEQE